MDILGDFDDADNVSVDTLALEKIVLEERSREISELKSLSTKVHNLHTSLLYYRNTKSKMGTVCYEAWKTLVKKVGGSQNGWLDLGHCLQIAGSDLDYIKNSVKDDPVDTVLKVYMQNEKATLDKIIDAFVTLNRYDILKSIEEPFLNLAQCFNKDDSGYQSNGKTNGSKEIISLTKNLPNDLPLALNKNIVIKDKDPQKPNHPKPRSPPKKADKENKNDTPILFLTFTEDGHQTAQNIQDYVEGWTDVAPVTVITLSDKREEVYQNPEKFIREYFEKADFVVPIITSGYLNEIRSCDSNGPNTTDNLDYKYVNFIYTLIVNHYIHATGCLNKKVRTVLPQRVDVDVFRHISMYPDLMPWTHESKFNEQFKAFLKKGQT
ncbi:uncharacterized protein LOC114362367 [Ostrinia furnacalis]|uniref:uncharacterized protein LOC114362367 n=1 Tax=Ostrinia furnacalis TaxID=93504 RepID=UPI00103E120D|nr:uncharacterized protein LOC114362367 [Ostrinia furnacalis]